MAQEFGSGSRPRAKGHDLALRLLLSKLIRGCSKTRAQIAEELTDLSGLQVTVHMLNDFTAESKGNARFPAALVRSLCEVLESDEILVSLARPRLRKQIELAEKVSELRRICDELLAELQNRPSAHQPKKRSSERKSGRRPCAQ